MNLGALQCARRVGAMDGAHLFQSSVDRTMPIRLMHYVACFYSELLKQKVITPYQGLPPVFPVVLYNGVDRWAAPLDVYRMIAPEPP
ncbi:Rpn family recombination-promoting nuclease/putative transposase, partial [Chromohalobacter sp. 48-RD10]|uniref:Rpn family recombination-promoting nuclease/putative transposase n=1 Tax=Chromohalobacter sp. 48-RD10 TaxID=2994063 RepID=UPI0032AF2673